MRLDVGTSCWLSHEEPTQRTIFCRDYQLTEHMFLELQLDRNRACLVDFNLRITTNRRLEDHVGASLQVGFLGFWFDICLYDHRHATIDSEEEW